MQNANEIITKLKKKYKGDNEAIDMIEQAERDIRYIEAKEKKGNYSGQPSISKAMELEAYLNDWC